MLYLGMLSKRSVGDLQSTKQLVMLYVLDNGPYQKVQIIFYLECTIRCIPICQNRRGCRCL